MHAALWIKARWDVIGFDIVGEHHAWHDTDRIRDGSNLCRCRIHNSKKKDEGKYIFFHSRCTLELELEIGEGVGVRIYGCGCYGGGKSVAR